MKNFGAYIHPIYKRIDLWLFTATVIFFVSYPKIDLQISAYYYKDGQFLLEENSYVQFVAWLFGHIHIFYFLIFAWLGLRSFYKDQKELTQKFLFLLISLSLSYAVFARLLFEDYSFGRPLPLQVHEFDGILPFSKVFEYSGACKENCSFVSSHAVSAFFLLAVAWVREQRIWIAYGLLLGTTVGFMRIIQGASFLSDVVFAGWLTWFCCVIVAKKMSLVTHKSKPNNP